VGKGALLRTVPTIFGAASRAAGRCARRAVWIV